jgi:hypothetical protein
VKVGVIVAAAIIFWFSSPVVHGFELADYDPWYYQSTDQGIKFWVPDKAQHCWGSAILNELGKKLNLPGKKVTTPLMTLCAGFMYEVWQERQGIGFSGRDLLADALGIVSSEFSTKNLVFYMDYSSRDKIITFNVKHIF